MRTNDILSTWTSMKLFVPLHLTDPRGQDPSWNENQQVSWRKRVLAAWNSEREGELKGKMIEVHLPHFQDNIKGTVLWFPISVVDGMFIKKYPDVLVLPETSREVAARSPRVGWEFVPGLWYCCYPMVGKILRGRGYFLSPSIHMGSEKTELFGLCQPPSTLVG